MHPDDDSQTTLSKWPFILGDILLVATALAIAILGDWQLSNWQVGACVAAVALGAALFVLPYIVEFRVRVREEHEDREGDLRVLEKHIHNAEQAFDTLDARTRALEGAAAKDDPAATLAELMDQKLAQVETARLAQEEAIKTLQKSLDELAAKEAPTVFDPSVLKPLEKRLEALEAKPSIKAEAPAVDKESVSPAKEPVKAKPKKPEAKAEAKAPETTTEKKEPAKPAKQVAPVERPKREARERHGPEESRLLKRAISEKGDKSSEAVSRIIESKTKEEEAATEPAPKEEKPEEEKKDELKPVVPEPEVKEEAKELPREAGTKKEEETEKPKAKTEEPVPGKKKDSNKVTPPPEKEEPKAVAKLEPEKKPKPVEKPKPEKKPEPVAAPEAEDKDSEAAEPEMLFDEENITSPVQRTKAKKNDAVITASVFIGIGNKPYLRGSGAGLNWEKGVVMEFQEIGKWRWVAPSDLEAPLELQIYRNDEDPDKSGKCTLEPGQKLEVTPVF